MSIRRLKREILNKIKLLSMGGWEGREKACVPSESEPSNNLRATSSGTKVRTIVTKVKVAPS